MWYAENMGTTRYEWTVADRAATQEMAEEAYKQHLSYRQIAEMSGNRIRRSRVRDLLVGESAPARFSELLTMGEVLGCTPMRFIARILNRADLMQREEHGDEPATPNVSDPDAQSMLEDGLLEQLAVTDKDAVRRIVKSVLEEELSRHLDADAA